MEPVIKDFNRILDILEADLGLTYQPLETETVPERIQQLRRAYFRTAFTYIEAIVFQLKRLSVSEVDSSVRFTAAEVALLNEETYSLRNNGSPRTQSAHLPLLDNMRFTANMFSKAHRSTFDRTYDDQGWRDLREAQTIRNRITHPKSPTELEVSGSEMMEILSNLVEGHRDASLVAAEAADSKRGPALRGRLENLFH
jgi:hypothetical protein